MEEFKEMEEDFMILLKLWYGRYMSKLGSINITIESDLCKTVEISVKEVKLSSLEEFMNNEEVNKKSH